MRVADELPFDRLAHIRERRTATGGHVAGVGRDGVADAKRERMRHRRVLAHALRRRRRARLENVRISAGLDEHAALAGPHPHDADGALERVSEGPAPGGAREFGVAARLSHEFEPIDGQRQQPDRVGRSGGDIAHSIPPACRRHFVMRRFSLSGTSYCKRDKLVVRELRCYPSRHHDRRGRVALSRRDAVGRVSEGTPAQSMIDGRSSAGAWRPCPTLLELGGLGPGHRLLPRPINGLARVF